MALKQTINSAVLAIADLSVHTIQLAHALRERRAWCFDEQMVVIVHKAVGMTQPAILVDDLRKCGEKPHTIFVLADDTLTGVSASTQIVDGVEKLETERASHAGTLFQSSAMCDYKT